MHVNIIKFDNISAKVFVFVSGKDIVILYFVMQISKGKYYFVFMVITFFHLKYNHQETKVIYHFWNNLNDKKLRKTHTDTPY